MSRGYKTRNKKGNKLVINFKEKSTKGKDGILPEQVPRQPFFEK